MGISAELATFCQNWHTKAEGYSQDDVAGAFDRFFTLYVVFNRLYAEATFRFARSHNINLGNRFPDARAATDYVIQFCGADVLTAGWEGEPNTVAAYRLIAQHIRDRNFALKLDLVTGERRRQADDELLAALESQSRNERAKAGLEVLYAIRCNMFHGHKGFEPIQLQLLQPALTLLESTICLVRRALENQD